MERLTVSLNLIRQDCAACKVRLTSRLSGPHCARPLNSGVLFTAYQNKQIGGLIGGSLSPSYNTFSRKRPEGGAVNFAGVSE